MSILIIPESAPPGQRMRLCLRRMMTLGPVLPNPTTGHYTPGYKLLTRHPEPDVCFSETSDPRSSDDVTPRPASPLSGSGSAEHVMLSGAHENVSLSFKIRRKKGHLRVEYIVLDFNPDWIILPQWWCKIQILTFFMGRRAAERQDMALVAG